MTPGVIVTGIVCASLVTLGVVACVAYLAARGFDPGPVVQLAGTVATACVSLLGLVLQLTGRKTHTRVDRNVGVLASAVAGQLDEDGQPTGEPLLHVSRANNDGRELAGAGHAGAVLSEQTTWLPPVPAPARRPRHRMPADLEARYGNGPDAAGEAENRAR